MRRMWTLLLTVLALTMILAVPAMAATHTAHESGQTWSALSADTTIVEGGYYYLEEDLTASLTVSAKAVTICLNGQTWEGSGARPLTITGSGSVTVCDCGDGGQMKGYDYGGATENGGAVNVASGASFTLESGTITGGRAKNGGNIYSTGTVTISGGTVSDGETGAYGSDKKYTTNGWGGNIYSTGTLTISGGTISGGQSGGNGGSVYNSGTMTMTAGTITGGDSRDNGGNIFTTGSMSLTGGTVTLGTAYSGGNISANTSKAIVLKNVEITGGTSCGSKYVYGGTALNSSSGGNVRIFNQAASSVTIGDGTTITGGSTKAAVGKNVYISNATTVNIGSVTIDGYVDIADGSTVNLSGAPSITGGTVNLSIGSSTLNAADMTGGSVGITATGEGRAFSGTVDSAYADYFTTDAGSELDVMYHGATDYKCMWLADKWCVCGASKNGGDHIQFTDANGSTVGCTGDEVAWLPLKTTIPTPITSSVNYYLTQDEITTSGQITIGTSSSTAATAVELRIDLNGKKISTSKNRGFWVYKFNTLTITDTSADRGGSFVNTANHDQGGIVWLNSGNATFNLYAGTMDASKFSNQGTAIEGGSAVCMAGDTSVFNMYGGTLIASDGSKYDGTSKYYARRGAAVCIRSGATFNMYAGTITGGKVGTRVHSSDTGGSNLGGAVYAAGSMNYYGGSITGGKNESDADSNVYVASSGTLNVYPLAENSSIGISAAEAGVFANVTSAVTLADKACFTSDSADYIVALTDSGLELVASDAHVHCPCNGTVGNADNNFTHTLSGHVCREVVYTAASSASDLTAGGSFYLTADITGSVIPTADLDVCLHGQTWTHGGSSRPLSVNAGITVTVADCDGTGSVVGYTYTASGCRGGTVNVVDGVLELYGGTLVGGTATDFGGAICINDTDAEGVAELHIFGGTVSGGEAAGNGGSIRTIGASSVFNMYGGTVTGGKTDDQGGNVFCAGYMNLYGGTITKGEALNKNGGGNIAINSPRAIVMQGVTVTDGKALNGGNIRISSTQSAGSLTIGAGTYISGGQAKNGGNIYVANNNANATSGTRQATLNIAGGTIENGVVTGNSATANIYAVCSEKTGVTTVVNLKFSGGTVKGYVYAEDGVTVTLSGAPVIDGGDDCQSNLELCSNKLSVNKDLSASARVFLSCADAANGTVVAEGITDGTDVSGIYYHGSQYALYYDALAGTLSLGQPGAALVNGDLSTVYPTLQEAIDAAGTGDYVRLVADYSGDALEIGTLYLDLNGFDITSDINVSGTLYLFDSKTADYSVKVGEELTGFGTVTGTVTGTVDRDFTTKEIRANYENHNYRYMVICMDGVYSSHRIYLTVKSTILYPQTPALNYRTVLRCNEYIANLINTQGSGYGIVLQSNKYDASAANYQGAVSYTYGDLVESGGTVLPYQEENGVVVEENNVISRLNNILDTSNRGSTENQYTAAANVVARAYIWINDDFTADSITGAEIYASGFCSSSVSGSLKSMIQSANSDSKWATLTEAQKTALGGMYGVWIDLMGSWDLHNIATKEDVTIRYGCVCGDPDSTDNPCAEKGHIEFAWKPTSSLPTDSGNWYLTGTVTLTGQKNISKDALINLNTCGYSITAGTDRVALVYGVLNLTNYSFTSGTPVDETYVTGHGHNTNDSGGALLIMSNGNVSIYDNVTVQVDDEHTTKNGAVYVSGSLNIYGGKILGGDVTGNDNGKGGAVYVASSGRMYMSSGSIEGGKSVNGGAIYAAGAVTIENGTVKDGQAYSASAKSYGGNIYVASGGSFTLSGGTVKDGTASSVTVDTTVYYGYGGNIYVASGGAVTLSGGAVEDGQAGTYGTTNDGQGGNIYAKNGAALTIQEGAAVSGGKANGNGGSIHVDDGVTFTMSGGILSGGQTLDQGGNLFLNENATITGGTITLGQAGNGGNLALGNSSDGVSVVLRGVTVSGGTATSNGGNIRVQNANSAAGTSLTIEAGTTVTGGQAGNGGNIHANCDLTLSGGTVQNGTASTTGTGNASGGNIYSTGAVAVSGGTVKDGTASSDGGNGYGGNLYISGTGTLALSGSASIEGGSCDHNGGSIYINGKSFTMSGGSVTGGHAQNAAGNFYISSNTTANISGGSITGGRADTTGANANIFVVSSTLNLSGNPTIDGGVQVYSNSAAASLSLTGSPVVTGTGILLAHSKKSDGTYYAINVTLDLDKLNAGTGSVVLRYEGFTGDYTNGITLAAATDNWTSHPYERVARQVLQDYTGNAKSEIAYDADGIHIRKSTGNSQKWTCLCGANYGESHNSATYADGTTVACSHFDELYKPWTTATLPNKPGNWYLSYADSKFTTNAAGVKYFKGYSTSTMSYDWYVDSNGDYQAVYTALAVSTAGSTMTDSAGKPVTVADYTSRYENGVPSYAGTVNASTTAQTVAYVATNNTTTYTAAEITPLTEYEIRVDLNGYKLETASGSRAVSFRGYVTKTAVNDLSNNCNRTAQVTLNILDSSKDHTGALATYGVYSEVKADGTQTVYSNGGTQFQGKLIWMPNSWDALNTSYVTLDASSTVTGIGLVVYNNGGRVTLNSSTVIGGTAQGFYKESDDALATTDITGGGAIAVFDGGTLTVNGGTVKNGTSIYRTILSSANGVTYEQAVGGGNIFIKNGTLNLNGATITGGKALIYSELEAYRLPSYSYGSGGGIYVLEGDVNISGNTVIKDNYTGTITAPILTATSTSNNFYECLDVRNASSIKATTQSNLFLGGNTMTLSGLTGEVHYSMTGNSGSWSTFSTTIRTSATTTKSVSYDLSTGGYVGTFATYTGTAPTTATLICDDSNAPAYTVSSGKVYYPWTKDDTFTDTTATYSAVGYGKSSIQPSLADLQGGYNMTNYGPDRWTNELYATSGSLNSTYYDIVADSAGYFDGWDTMCYATALATADAEGDTVIIIALDAQTMGDSAIVPRIKRMVSYATGVPQDNISVSAAHQHSIPGPTVRYQTQEVDGVKSNVLDTNGKAIEIYNYDQEFFTGIVRAAVNAVNDRQKSTVEVGTLETTADGKQYNFVRNVKLYTGSTFLGMVTDNHHDLVRYSGNWYIAGTGSTNASFSALTQYADGNVTLKYESTLDTTLQLVRYHQVKDDYDIIMANFRTHPHLGSGSSSYYVHSDVVGAFRYNLEKLYKADGSNVVTLYFSGGGGNVNTTTYYTEATNNTGKYPYSGQTLETASATEALQKLEKASIWGQELAQMTYNFLENKVTYSDSTQMTAVSGSTDVAVTVKEVTLTTKPSDATNTAIANVVKIRKWSDNSYVTEFVGFGSTAGDTTYGNWYNYVGQYSNAADRVYSSFDSNNIRRSLLWQEAGYTTEDITITAYAMGEIGFVAAPYEMFQENDSAIRAGTARIAGKVGTTTTGSSGNDYAMTIVSTLANRATTSMGAASYIPSLAGYTNGGYSTDQSRYASGTGEQLVNEFVKMLNGLK